MVKAVLAAASTLATQLVSPSRQPQCYCPTSGEDFSTGTDPPPSHGNMATEVRDHAAFYHTLSPLQSIFRDKHASGKPQRFPLLTLTSLIKYRAAEHAVLTQISGTAPLNFRVFYRNTNDLMI